MFSRVFCKIREETTNDDRSSYPKVVGSNPSSATMINAEFVYQTDPAFFMLMEAKYLVSL